MNRRDELQERYDETVFALLMNEIVELDGADLLAEAERLNNDPEAAIPEALDAKCREAILNSAHDKCRKKTGRSATRTVKRVALLVAAVTAIIGAAYASKPTPQFDPPKANIVLHANDAHVTLKSEDVETYPADGNSGYLIDEYKTFQDSTYQEITGGSKGCSSHYIYENADGDVIEIELLDGSKHASKVIDTEDAQTVTNVTVNGYEGICVEKDGAVQIAWTDTDRVVHITFYATGMDMETALEAASTVKYVEPTTLTPSEEHSDQEGQP